MYKLYMFLLKGGVIGWGNLFHPTRVLGKYVNKVYLGGSTDF